MSTTPDPISVSATLADFVAGTAWNAITADVKQFAQRATAASLHGAGLGIASAGAEAAFGVVGRLGSAPEAGVVGRPERLAAPDAAFVNASAARAGGAQAGTAVVALAALAAAEAAGADGPATMRGIVLGLEVAARVEAALGASHRARGYDTAGTAGRVGAAAAVAAVLGLDAAGVHSAFGYAATTANGLAAAAPPAVSALIAGLAAADGIRSARYARAGLIGPPEPLEGRRGLLALESDDGDPSCLVDGLGARWWVLEGPDAAALGSFAGTLVDAAVALSNPRSVGELVAAAGAPVKPER
jgi:2-methylcitrate dehydratase PrpD